MPYEKSISFAATAKLDPRCYMWAPQSCKHSDRLCSLALDVQSLAAGCPRIDRDIGSRPVASGCPGRPVGHDYLARLTQTWTSGANADDVGKLIALFHADVVYEHPRAGALVEGASTVREGMLGFLGASRSPRVRDLEIAEGRGVLILQFRLDLEVRDGSTWQAVNRRQIIVLEIRDGLITRIIDYW